MKFKDDNNWIPIWLKDRVKALQSLLWTTNNNFTFLVICFCYYVSENLKYEVCIKDRSMKKLIYLHWHIISNLDPSSFLQTQHFNSGSFSFCFCLFLFLSNIFSLLALFLYQSFCLSLYSSLSLYLYFSFILNCTSLSFTCFFCFFISDKFWEINSPAHRTHVVVIF
jgi:hypothetical protein